MDFDNFLRFLLATIFSRLFHFAHADKFRIIGGRKAAIEEFPYQVVMEKWTLEWCGGSVLNKHYVLSAAHCVKGYENYSPVPSYILQIRVGSQLSGNGGAVHQIQNVTIHPKYDDDSQIVTHDVSILRVTEPIVFNAKVQPIPLAKKNPEEGTLMWVTGFGRREAMRSGRNSKPLMAVQVPLVSLESCRKKLDNVADDMICAGFADDTKDSCTGDSGGPMAANNELVGIVAWGIGCGRKGLPGVYTSMSYHRDWILKQIE